MKNNEESETKPSRWNLVGQDWREIRIVLVAGSVGGFASWVYGVLLGEPVPGGWWSVPTAIFLGAFAAGIGVYVLTNTDTSAVARTLFFAALCGFVWKPVCDAGKAFIQQTVQKQQDADAEEISSKVEALANSLAATPPDQQAAKLEEIHESAVTALDSLPRVHSVRVQRDVEAKVNNALTVVSEAAPKNPQVAASVLQSVGESAARNRAVRVSNRALTSLDKLAETNRAFAPARLQLRTNILNTVSDRYLLRSGVLPR